MKNFILYSFLFNFNIIVNHNTFYFLSNILFGIFKLLIKYLFIFIYYFNFLK